MNGDSMLADRYQAVRARIDAAARAAGRDPATVRLLAVSKTFDAAAVAALAALGQRAFGENYLQEALDKIERLAQMAPVAGPSTGSTAGAAAGALGRLEWHFIGPIQSNKTRRIAEAFDWVHSVESLRIARRLSDQRPPERAPLAVCVQVNVSGEASKSGCAPQDAVALAAEVAALPRLALRGLMAIPEPTDDPALQAARFATLRELLDAVRRATASGRGPAPDTLSMGMSADLEAAIAAGATIVRVGTALFGSRG
ncbi:MAG: YggS family pyridoxal phosphate-dependent enzyme [Lautropia sp.]